MKHTKAHKSSKTTVTPADDRERARRKQERYAIIAEIAAARKPVDAYIDFAFKSNWDDR